MGRPPQRLPQQSAQPSQAHKFIIFDDLPKMNTKPMRQNLTEKEAAWIENLQPVAGNDLSVVPAPLSELTTVTGKTVSRMFPAAIRQNIGDPASPIIDYIIFFATDGSATAINAADGTQVEFAPPGTFVPPSDMTTWSGERILIADPGITNPNAFGGFTGAGYSTWDGTAFVAAGGLSPNFIVTNGGAGYTSAPAVSIVSAYGSGATAEAIVAGGAVVQIVLTNQGENYGAAGSNVEVVIGGGGGAGATATVVAWPMLQATSVAVFQGRVWTSFRRTINYTGTNGFDDVNAENAAGFTTIEDADLVHEIVGLRALNNYLYIFGDQSVKQIGGISVSTPTNSAGQATGPPTTNFQILTLASDIGCPFIMSVLSYNRITVFANKQGVYAIYGASVQKVSDDMDGVWRRIDFTQEPCAALFDLNNIHCYSLLIRYQDPNNIQIFGVQPQGGINVRSLICVLQAQNWWVVNQGPDLMSIVSLPMLATDEVEMFGTPGSDIIWLLTDPSTAVTWILRTGLSAHNNIIQAKRGIRAGVAVSGSVPTRFTMSIDTENASNEYKLYAAGQLVWRNHSGDIITFQVSITPATTIIIPADSGSVPGLPRLDTRATSGPLHFMVGPGFKLPYSSVDAYGRVLGASLFGTNDNMAVNAIMMEYVDADFWGTNELVTN